LVKNGIKAERLEVLNLLKERGDGWVGSAPTAPTLVITMAKSTPGEWNFDQNCKCPQVIKKIKTSEHLQFT
jgi:hypothetical protein